MAYIGNSPGSIQRGRRAVYEFTATNAQTVFSGTDDNGISLDLQDSNENDVYLNGSRLIFNDDYTIAGEVLTLTAAAAAGDILVIVTQDDIANVASYTKAETDARYINYDGDIVNGDLQISGEVDTGSLIVDTDVLVVDATNDIVGIGIATPSTTASGYEGGTLHIHNAGTGSSIRLTNSTTGTGTSAGMLISKWSDSKTYFTNFDAGADTVFTPTDSGGSLVANTLVIKSNGNVGIGTSNPGKKLDISGEIRNVAGQTITPAATSLYAADSTLSSYATTNGVYLNGHQNGWLRLNGDGTNRASIDLYGSGYNNFNDEIHFKTGNVGNRLVISNDGNVGIGTSSPSSLLDVDQSQNAETNIELTNTNTGSAAQVRTKYTTDGGLFTVGKTSDAHAFGGDAYLYNVDNTNIRFATSDTERMRISSGGTTTLTTNSAEYYQTGMQINSQNADFSGALLDMRATSGSVNTANGRFLRFYSDNGSTERFHVKGSGEIYTAAGIKFDDAGGSGTPTSNTLDSYEEGSWTPAFGGAGSPSYTTQFGSYTKVGRIVYCAIAMRATSVASSAVITLTGLPFASVGHSDNGQRSTLVLANGGHLNSLSEATAKFRINGSSMTGVKGNSSTTYMLASQMTTGGTIQFTGEFWYYTA